MSLIEKFGMDSVKLHCCDKATIAGCRKLCLKTFTNEWSTSWNDFHSECLSHPNEDQLLKCMDDGEDKCRLEAFGRPKKCARKSIIIIKRLSGGGDRGNDNDDPMG